MRTFTRRTFLASGAALIAGASVPSRAQAPVPLTGIDWGGPLIEAPRKITAGDKNVDVTWELHSGGAGTGLPKIKSAWPNQKYDIVAARNPHYVTMPNQDWLAQLKLDEVPHRGDA